MHPTILLLVLGVTATYCAQTCFVRSSGPPACSSLFEYTSTGADRSQALIEIGQSRKVPPAYLKLGPPEDFQSIVEYTGYAYTAINYNLRSNPSPSTWEYTTKCACSGLRRIPSDDSVVFRGWQAMPKDFVNSKWQTGQIWRSPTFISSSRNLAVADGFAGKVPLFGSGNLKVLWIIASSSGVFIEDFTLVKGEFEVLFRPEAAYKILAHDWYYTVNSVEIFAYELAGAPLPATTEKKLEEMLRARYNEALKATTKRQFEEAALHAKLKRAGLLKRRAPRQGPPASWNCSATYYAADDGCDCNCGAWDPDCDNSTSLFGCNGPSAICVEPGLCIYSSPPVSWFCNPAYYHAGDGCDCGCGAFDPDCNNTSEIVFGCASLAALCSPTGTCVNHPGAPTAWICDSSFYGTGDGCDCSCGAPDPDCSDVSETVYGCPCANMTCTASGFCVGYCNGYTLSVKAFGGTLEPLLWIAAAMLLILSIIA